MYEIITNSEKETINFAKNFAKELHSNDIVILSGQLGAGKTKFVQGILEYFGLEKEISSPTFTIVNEYNANPFNIYHFDLYRLSDIDEFFDIGGEEYLTSGGICIIEWGEMLEPLLNKNYYKLSFTLNNLNPNSRTIRVEKF